MRVSQRGVVAAVVAFGMVAVSAASANAHITVNPSEAEAGGFARLSFRVPNERPDSGTSQVEVNMPDDHPIANVSVRPVPGWEYEIERRTLEEPLVVHGNEVTEVVGKVTWTGGPINPGEFQEFDVSVGPLPEDADSLAFPALQTYESGEVVRWIEDAADSEEPEHPVPVLTIVPGGGHGADGGEDGDGDATAVDGETAAATPDDDDSSSLAVVALVVAIVAVLGAALALVRGSRTR